MANSGEDHRDGMDLLERSWQEQGCERRVSTAAVLPQQSEIYRWGEGALGRAAVELQQRICMEKRSMTASSLPGKRKWRHRQREIKTERHDNIETVRGREIQRRNRAQGV
ncbi:2570_t:CDS:2 [Acaulospora colombiana]|uniref:2570_t:CDS:1 n=1 Tax=Acaulospora colombiana TaxID=27376 RepID=A0ACA9LBQ2_9GLOM|nr:2570_t:CDS:2 [Acaulospora colombiana]